MTKTFRSTDLRALFGAVALTAALSGCKVDQFGQIPCDDNSNCTADLPTCSSTGFCVAAGTATTLEAVSGSGQTGGIGAALAQPFVVRVRDNNGNIVQGATVTWAVTSTSGTITPASSTTGANGTASANATLGLVSGAQTFTASVAGLSGSPVTFTATALPGVATTLKTVSGNSQTGVVHTALAAPFVVQVTDANNNGVPGVAVVFAAATGGGSVAPLTVTTGPDGTASATGTLGNTVGVNTYTATSGTLATPQTFSATGTPGTAATFTVTFPTSIVANSTNSAVVKAFDVFGNQTSYTGTVKVTTGVADPLATLPAAFALTIPAGGSASVSGIKLGTAMVGQSVTVTDTTVATITGTQTGVIVTPASSSTALTATPNPSVFGNPVTFTATVTSTTSTSPGTPTGTVTFKDGSTTIGTAPLVAGIATLATSALLGGSHAITAVFGGDTTFAASTSNTVTEIVNGAPTATALTLTAGTNPSTFGQSVTFTATVTNSTTTKATGSVTFKDGSTTIGTSALTPGTGTTAVASFSTVALTGGVHSITAVYGGDGNFLTSTSGPLSQTVNPTTSTTALATSPNPSSFNSSVTFTATVTNATTTVATGTVTFKDGSTTLGTGTLNGAGVATFSTSALLGGTHSITAVYGGDGNFTTSTSTSVIQTVNGTASTTALTASPNPSVFNSSVTFTATVTNATATTATGTVTFKDGSTTLGTGTLNGSGVTTFSTSALTGGTHSITAVYGGDANFSPSTSTAVTQTVNPTTSTTAVATSGTPSVFNTSVTFTATVTNATTTTATGTVTFKDGSTTLGTGTLSSGVATFSTAALAGGVHTITAVYGGDGNFSGSTSPGLTQTVTPTTSNTALAAAPNPSTFNTSVTFTATVTNATGTVATGTVTFKDGSTTLGTGTLNGSGIATFATAALAGGTHSITAVYGGDGNFSGSTSTAVVQTVNANTSTTALTATPNPSAFTGTVTLTATVTNATATVATGTVTFKDGSTTLGTGALNGSGVATFLATTLQGGSHSLTAVYGGDSNFGSSTSNVVTQVVNPVASTTALAASPNPSTFNSSVTFTATVTNATTATATGTVTFKDGSTTLGTGTLNGSGVTTFVTSALTGGAHSITAVYGGDNNFTTSTSPVVTQTVNATTSTTALASSANPSTFNSSVTFTATVTNATTTTATGTVTFKDGSTTLGTGTLNGSGVATFATSALTGGAHSITAVYGGDGNFSTSTSTVLTQTVNPTTSSTAVSSSVNPSTFNSSVTFTATVTNATATVATGTVTFKDGSTTLGTGTLNGSGVATFATAALTGGAHSITAVYGGNANFSTSTSSILTQTVNTTTSSTAVASSANPSTFNSSVTFTATVTNATATVATGTVTFKDGSTTLGTGTLNGSGVATFATSALIGGSHSITAVYGGDANFGTSTSSVLTQTVNTTSSSTAVASSANPSTYNSSVTFTATVTNATATVATGTVTFKDGSTTLGTGTLNGSGVATFATAALLGGSHSITAVYGGDGNFSTSTSSILTQTVNKVAPTNVVAASPTSSTFGQAVTFTATIGAPSGGVVPTGSVTFTDTPSVGSAVVMGSAALNGSGVATLVYSALDAPGSSHTITAAYGGDGNYTTVGSSNTLLFNVTPASTTTVVTSSLNPSDPLQSVTFTATVTSPNVNPAAGTVTFLDNSVSIGTGSVNASGVATLATTTLAEGSHPITAVFSASGNYNTSTSAGITQVVRTTPSITVTTSANSIPRGQNVTYTAVVSSPAGTPTGTVQFTIKFNTNPPSNLLGPATLVSGTASVTLQYDASTTPATYQIQGVYSGDSTFLGRTSAVVPQTITSPPPVDPPAYGSTATSIIGGSAADGLVFIAGGSSTAGRTDAPSQQTWIYDASTSSMKAGPQLAFARAFHTAVAIGEGRVLVAGGNSGALAVPEFEICTLGGKAPACVATGGTLATSRCNAAAALVGQEPARVLIAGGEDCSAPTAALSSWDLWDASAADAPVSSDAANGLTEGRSLLTATALGDGSVLLAGGGSASADLFRLGPAGSDSSVLRAGAMSAARSGHSATLLPVGSRACPEGACVLIAGGLSAAGSTWEIFNASTAAFQRPADAGELVAPMRSRHAAVTLADGRVVLAGGTIDGATGLLSTEWFDAANLRFEAGLPLQAGRVGAGSAYLPAQDLMFLTGGAASGPSTELMTAP